MDAARRAVDLSFRNALRLIGTHVEELGALDKAAGDGDHGTTMVRGLRAANQEVDKLGSNFSAGQALAMGGGAFSNAAGGASGALFGMFLVSAGGALGNGPYDAVAVAAALRAGAAKVGEMGKAEVGDKTLVDTLAPFVAAMSDAADEGMDVAAAWQSALPSAQQGMQSTAGMVARKGRASKLGERGRDGLDPGAVSMYYLLQATGAAISEVCADGSAA